MSTNILSAVNHTPYPPVRPTRIAFFKRQSLRAKMFLRAQLYTPKWNLFSRNLTKNYADPSKQLISFSKIGSGLAGWIIILAYSYFKAIRCTGIFANCILINKKWGMIADANILKINYYPVVTTLRDRSVLMAIRTRKFSLLYCPSRGEEVTLVYPSS